MIKDLKKSFILLGKNKKKWLVNSLIDFVFILLVVLAAYYFLGSFTEKYNLLDQTMNSITIENDQLPADIFDNLSSISNILKQMLAIVVGLFIAVFVLWGMFQSVSWLISRNIFKNKKLLVDLGLDYFLDFVLLSFVWFLMLGIILYITYNYSDYLQSLNSIILMIPLILLIYFGTISFAVFSLTRKVVASLKYCFLLGVTKFLLLPFILFLIILIITGTILELFNVVMLNGFILIIFLTWFRIYLLILIEKFAGDRI